MKESKIYSDTIYFVDCPNPDCEKRHELGVYGTVDEEFKCCECGTTFMLRG